jgi:hypothetical protein
MKKQTSRDELISEIKTLLKRYEKEEQSDDERRSSEWNSLFRRANALWLIGEGPIANALQNHLRHEQISEFWAEYFEVSKDRFVGWRERRGNEVPFCSSIVAKTGAPCRELAHMEAEIPKMFVIGITDCCYRHKRDWRSGEYEEWMSCQRDDNQ